MFIRQTCSTDFTGNLVHGSLLLGTILKGGLNFHLQVPREPS